MNNMKKLFAVFRRRRVSVENIVISPSTRAAIREWMERCEYLQPESSITEVARQLGVSEDQFAFYFRLVERKPFKTWRKERRIQEAKRLLVERPDLPVCLIGEMVGISDKSNFRRQFTELVGVRPAEFRAKRVRKPRE